MLDPALARATFADAASRLTAEHIAAFEGGTGKPLHPLVQRVLELPPQSLAHALDVAGGELGNQHPHPLNANGLHVLKWLMARAITDERRIANGWASHAEHGTFARNGLLMRRLQNWKGSAKHVAFTQEETELIALASGWARWPYQRCADGTSGMVVSGTHRHKFTDADVRRCRAMCEGAAARGVRCRLLRVC